MELMEIFLSYWGVPYALFLMVLFIPWAKLTKKALNRRYSKATSLFSGMFFGILLSLFLALFATRVPHPPSAIMLASRINGVLALLLFIGLPISLLVRRSLTQAVSLPVRTGSRTDKITCNEGEPLV